MKINITLKGKPLADKKSHKVIYQVSCPKEPQKQIETPLKVIKSLWLNKKKNVSKAHPNWDIINEQLNEYKADAERLMLEFDLGKVTLRGIYDKLKGNNDGSSLDAFVDTWGKKAKDPNTYNNYIAVIRRFKSIVGVKGELKFSEINRSLINKFHREGNKLIGNNKPWSTATATSYMSTMKTICTAAYDEEVIETPVPFKRAYKWKQYTRGDNWGPSNKDILKLIRNTKNIRHWQTVAIWLLEFCCRGLYPQDLCEFDDSRMLNKKLESMEDFFLGGDVYLDHYRGKNHKPMYIKLFPVTLSLIRRLKFSLIYTDIDEKIGGDPVVTSINNRVNLVSYDRVKYPIKHKQFWRKFTDNFEKLGNKRINMKTARKSFVQVANDIEEIGYDNSQKLAGHSLGGVADKFYMNYKNYDTITFIDEMHQKILKKFNVEVLFNSLVNKLDELTDGKVPKWVIMNGGVHKVGRQYKILTGSENNLENADMDRKYIKYFLATKEWEMERELDETDRQLKNYENLQKHYQKFDIAGHILKALERDMNDLRKSRKVRSITEAEQLLKKA